MFCCRETVMIGQYTAMTTISTPKKIMSANHGPMRDPSLSHFNWAHFFWNRGSEKFCLDAKSVTVGLLDRRDPEEALAGLGPEQRASSVAHSNWLVRRNFSGDQSGGHDLADVERCLSIWTGICKERSREIVDQMQRAECRGQAFWSLRLLGPSAVLARIIGQELTCALREERVGSKDQWNLPIPENRGGDNQLESLMRCPDASRSWSCRVIQGSWILRAQAGYYVIPRLELLAAVLTVDLVRRINSNVDSEFQNVRYWMDSTNAISRETSRWQFEWPKYRDRPKWRTSS